MTTITEDTTEEKDPKDLDHLDLLAPLTHPKMKDLSMDQEETIQALLIVQVPLIIKETSMALEETDQDLPEDTQDLLTLLKKEDLNMDLLDRDLSMEAEEEADLSHLREEVFLKDQ